MFDPNAFLQETITAEGSTKVELIPQGEYVAFVANSDDLSKWFRQNEITKGDRAGEMITAAKIPFRLDNPALQEKLGRNALNVVMDCVIDLTPDGKLDMGKSKNTRLNRLRAALGQNSADKPWSWAMLPGSGPLMVKVTHRQDPKDSSKYYEEVADVSPIRR